MTPITIRTRTCELCGLAVFDEDPYIIHNRIGLMHDWCFDAVFHDYHMQSWIREKVRKYLSEAQILALQLKYL